MSLFDNKDAYQPLAAKMRPRCLDDFAGQEHLLAPGKPLRKAIETSSLHSMVLWGPPGVGKTTLARMISELCDVHFQSISAVLAGVKDIREAIAVAQQHRMATGRKTLLFVDEAHRFNKSQQGLAHSVECYLDSELVGGLYGIAMGKLFFGESMFHRETDASKVAFAFLNRLLQQQSCPLIDCQLPNKHLASLGAATISRIEFQKYLDLYANHPQPINWDKLPTLLSPW